MTNCTANLFQPSEILHLQKLQKTLRQLCAEFRYMEILADLSYPWHKWIEMQILWCFLSTPEQEMLFHVSQARWDISKRHAIG